MLEFIILGILFEETLTGYKLKKRIREKVGTFYRASFGSLYPLLKKLLKKDYLIMFEKPQGERQRKYYRITPKGEEVFFEWLKSPINLSDTTDYQLAKIYFFDKLPPQIRNEQLKEYELNSINALRKLQALKREIEQGQSNYYQNSTLYYGINVLQQTIKWCRHIRHLRPLEKLIEEDFEL